jgi:hypothetical protein
LPRGGTTNNKKENPFMTKKILQWQRIAMLATGIATSMVSMAWGQELYQTHSDGSIWEYTGAPCDGRLCPGWIKLDNNPNMSMIAAGGGALYEMHKDGSVWWYVGPACSGSSCPGWVELDDNPAGAAIGVGGSIPYEMHYDGSLWEYNGVICTGGSCPGWTELSGPQAGIQVPFAFLVGANATSLVYGNSDMYGENFYLFGGAINNWPLIDSSPYGLPFAVGTNTLYDLRQFPGYYSIRQYTGSPITYNWQAIFYSKYTGNGTVATMAAGGNLYVQRPDKNGNNSIWQYNGTPCDGTVCPGWVEIDNHPSSFSLVAGSTTAYQMRSSEVEEVSIWQYNGTPCSGGVCSGWVRLDDNPNTTAIVAGPVTFGYSASDGPVTFGGRSPGPTR